MMNGYKTGKREMFIIVVLLFFMLLPTAVDAFGIRPARQEIEFAPGGTFKGEFTIVRDTGESTEARLYVEGPLEPYVTFDQEKITLEGTEASIRYEVKLPEELPPGDQVSKLIVEQEISREDDISAKIKIPFKLVVRVPYPEKYIEADLEVDHAPGELEMTATVDNKGGDLSYVQPRVVLESGGSTYTSVSFNPRQVQSKQVESFQKTIDAQDFPNGLYQATASVIYDEFSLEIEKEFLIGQPSIITTYHDQYFKSGEINPFTFVLENKWSAPISEVRAFLVVEDGENTLARFQTEEFGLDAYEQKKITAFFDARSITPGKYSARLVVNHEFGSIEEPYVIEFLELEEFKKETGQTTNVGAISPTILVVISILALNTLLITFLVAKMLKRRR